MGIKEQKKFRENHPFYYDITLILISTVLGAVLGTIFTFFYTNINQAKQDRANLESVKSDALIELEKNLSDLTQMKNIENELRTTSEIIIINFKTNNLEILSKKGDPIKDIKNNISDSIYKFGQANTIIEQINKLTSDLYSSAVLSTLSETNINTYLKVRNDYLNTLYTLINLLTNLSNDLKPNLGS
jgi:hypothetical protein